MQTFLPYSDFKKCAEVLDKKRCWKQVIEAKQIITVLDNLKKEIEVPKIIENSIKKKRQAWENHPAVKMWKGYEELLKHYYNIFLDHCVHVRFINTRLTYIECNYSNGEFTDLGYQLVNGFELYGDLFKLTDKETPFWFNNEDFHRSHRARLIEKDREFYLPKFPDDEGFNDSKYLWPVNETKTFRVI